MEVVPEPLPVGVQTGGGDLQRVPAATDHLAIASAVCGLTALVPVISQVIGLVLGIASLRRIRRARQAGVEVRGKGWALTGIISSGFALLGWIAAFALLFLVGAVFACTGDTLDAIARVPG
jgi:hypothetical protein